MTALAAVVMMTLAGCQKTQKVESIQTAEDFDSYIQAGVLLMDIYADQYDN